MKRVRTYRDDILRSTGWVLRIAFVLGICSNAYSQGFRVSPDTIDFKRVHLLQQVDTAFDISNFSGRDQTVRQNNSILDSNYIAQFPKGSAVVSSGRTLTLPVHFKPYTAGIHFDSLIITHDDGLTTSDIKVYVVGIGTAAKIVSTDSSNIAKTSFEFGAQRVDSSRQTTINIVNRGNETAAVDSVSIFDGNVADFKLIPPILEDTLDYSEIGVDTSLSYSVSFTPKSLGSKTLVIKVHTTDGNTFFDVFHGRGVEPFVVTDTNVIDFGTVPLHVQSVDSTFTIYNLGGMRAVLDSITHRDTNFTVQLTSDSFPRTLDTNSPLQGTVTFRVREAGDFIDTIHIKNDSRYSLYINDPAFNNDTLPYAQKFADTIIILRAKVRTGPIQVTSVTFATDTITTCDPVEGVVMLHNPYPVGVVIDSMIFAPSAGGFDRSSTTQYSFPISIAADSTYPLRLQYAFPPDSINGLQNAEIILLQRRGGSDAEILDTIIAPIYRKQRVLTLTAKLPAFVSSATDIAPLKLPILMNGPHVGVRELDSWTLKLQFSNDLFVPVGIDTTNALATHGDSTFSFTTHWDQPSRTYTIIVTGSAVSDSSNAAKNLLLNLLLRAYLTTDTSVTVTPTFQFMERPCAYNLQPFTLSIPYADECGESTLREFMRGNTLPLTITGVWPQPVANTDLTIGYTAALDQTVTWSALNAMGIETAHGVANLKTGAGTFVISRSELPPSGITFLRIQGSNGLMAVVRTLTQH